MKCNNCGSTEFKNYDGNMACTNCGVILLDGNNHLNTDNNSDNSEARFQRLLERQKENMRVAEEKRTMDKRKKTIIVKIALCIAAILVVFFVGNSIAKSVVRSKMIGQVFEGEYRYTCDYFDYRLEMIVEIIDEKHCNIYFDGKNDNRGSEPDTYFQKEYFDLPYKLSGGIFGVKFTWEGGHDNPVDPFEVNFVRGELRYLNTWNFNSHEGARLYIVEE